MYVVLGYTSIDRALSSATFIYLTTPEMRTSHYWGHFNLFQYNVQVHLTDHYRPRLGDSLRKIVQTVGTIYVHTVLYIHSACVIMYVVPLLQYLT